VISPQIALACALALETCVGTTAAQADPPVQPFLLGAYTGVGVGVAQFEAEIGHTIAIVDHFEKFDMKLKGLIAEDIAAGRTPMISWNSDEVGGGSVLATDILNGVYDQQIKDMADSLAALNGTILVEWQPEMTANKRNALFFAGVAPAQWGPTYIAVWKYMRAIFAAEGATNTQWVWSPIGNAYKTQKDGTITCGPYFPGAAYVDWMGLHTFNKLDTPVAFGTDVDVVWFYYQAPIFAPGLPLIISQTAASHKTTAQQEWITTSQSSIETDYPLIRGYVWFNQDEPQQPGSSRQYTLAGQGLTAFSAMANDPFYQ
jgi:hypothetical protein